MSAYALPGLFPPLPFDYGLINVSVGSTALSSSESEPKTSFLLDYSTIDKEEKTECETMPFHPKQDSLFSDRIQICVKEARLDTVQLIQSLSSSAVTSSSSHPMSKKRTRPRRRNSPPMRPERSAITADTKELAMQFELDINWNDRQYTSVRSLHRIRLLREELMSELTMLQGNHCYAVVPEFPSLPESGGSFTMLQALLYSHVPVIEAWLSKVFGLVECIGESAALTNFILEPVCSVNTPVQRLSLSERLPTLLRHSSLTSIEEDHEDDEEKESH